MGILHFGVHAQLEEIADKLIKDSLEGVTSIEAKRDILTPWKEHDRKSREVYTRAGVPQPEVRHGIYHRAYNRTSPHLNSRDGTAVRGERIPKARSTTSDTTKSYWGN